MFRHEIDKHNFISDVAYDLQNSYKDVYFYNDDILDTIQGYKMIKNKKGEDVKKIHEFSHDNYLYFIEELTNVDLITPTLKKRKESTSSTALNSNMFTKCEGVFGGKYQNKISYCFDTTVDENKVGDIFVININDCIIDVDDEIYNLECVKKYSNGSKIHTNHYYARAYVRYNNKENIFHVYYRKNVMSKDRQYSKHECHNIIFDEFIKKCL